MDILFVASNIKDRIEMVFVASNTNDTTEMVTSIRENPPQYRTLMTILAIPLFMLG